MGGSRFVPWLGGWASVAVRAGSGLHGFVAWPLGRRARFVDRGDSILARLRRARVRSARGISTLHRLGVGASWISVCGAGSSVTAASPPSPRPWRLRGRIHEGRGGDVRRGAWACGSSLPPASARALDRGVRAMRVQSCIELRPVSPEASHRVLRAARSHAKLPPHPRRGSLQAGSRAERPTTSPRKSRFATPRRGGGATPRCQKRCRRKPVKTRQAAPPPTVASAARSLDAR